MRQEEKRNRVEEAIRSFYEEKTVAPHLVDSVLYSIQAGGKRLRPLLLLELLEAFGQDLTDAHFQVAGALERFILAASFMMTYQLWTMMITVGGN